MNSPLSLCAKRPWISSLVLSFGFALTGTGTVMLGVLLPVLSAKWGLRDDAAGFLFFLQFLGSTLGAVLTGTNHMRTLRCGYGLLCASACALAFAGPFTAFPFYFFFGLGLGLAMTATSLVISDRYGDDCAAKLEQINFAWSLGAAAAPVLVIPFMNVAGLRPLSFIFLALFLCLFVWTLAFEHETINTRQRSEAATSLQGRASLVFFLPLVALAMCSVGAETSLSGWLTTYSHRSASLGLASAAITTAIFWLGMVLSRLAFSTRLLRAIGRRHALLMLLWGTAFAVALVAAAHDPTLVRTAAGLAGLCIGPLYPLILSFLLERTSRGWIFAAGGVGAVIFPWLTGLLSAQFGSLRLAMIAPCGAAMLMLLLLPLSFRSPQPAIPAISRR